MEERSRQREGVALLLGGPYRGIARFETALSLNPEREEAHLGYVRSLLSEGEGTSVFKWEWKTQRQRLADLERVFGPTDRDVRGRAGAHRGGSGQVGVLESDLAAEVKSADWKVAIAAWLKLLCRNPSIGGWRNVGANTAVSRYLWERRDGGRALAKALFECPDK